MCGSRSPTQFRRVDQNRPTNQSSRNTEENVSHISEKPARKSIDEILGGSDRKNPSDMSRKSIGRILGGIDRNTLSFSKVPSTSIDQIMGGHSIETPLKSFGQLLKGDEEKTPSLVEKPWKTVDEILKCEERLSTASETSRKSISQILSGAKNMSVGTVELTVSPEAHVSDSIFWKPTAQILGIPRILTPQIEELPQLIKNPEQMNQTVSDGEDTVHSNRVVFDFSTPAQLKLDKLRNQTSQRIRRLKLLHKALNFDQSRTQIVTTFKIFERNDAGFNMLFQNQVQTQTDDLVGKAHEESQTDQSELTNKWTQKPPQFSKPESGIKPNFTLLKFEGVGVGPDPLLKSSEKDKYRDQLKSSKSIKVSLDSPSVPQDDIKLMKFVRKSSKLILSLLEANSIHTVSASILGGNAEEEATLLEFNRGLTSLNKLRMHTLYCQGDHVACANVPMKQENVTTGRHQEVKNIVTVWLIRDPEFPIFFLRIWGQVTVIRMAIPSDIIVCGSHNGGLNIWNLKEDEKIHTPFQDVYIRTPSFHTGCMEGVNHHTRIVGLEILPETKSSSQIISMDKENTIICWSVIQTPMVEEKDVSENSTAWSTLHIRIRQVLKLTEMFSSSFMISNCLNVWEGDQKYFLIGTDNGFVGKGRIVPPELNSRCEKYYGETRDTLIQIHHVDINVKLNLFIAACGDKYIRMFEMSRTKAILSVECNQVPMKIMWSQQRFSVFYVAFHNEIAIWDLVASDLEPVKNCPANGLQDIHLLLSTNQEHMAMITHGGLKLFIVIPSIDLTPLNANHEKLLRHYISIIN